MAKRKEANREPQQVKQDIGIPELENRREYEILQLGIIIATGAGMKAYKATADTTLKFIDNIIKELENDNK
jgi:hypothetical protein